MGLSIMAAEAISQELELRRVIKSGEQMRVGTNGAENCTVCPQKAEELLVLLRRHQGNISEVARELGVSRPTIYRNMKKYGIKPEETWIFS